MASIGHVAVGMAAARAYHEGQVPRWPSLVWWSLLSLLPDVDVIGFTLGVDYAAPWGHRGAAHSLTSSVALGLSIGLAARWLHWPSRRIAVFATLVVASHGLLDTMTDGGLGCALFWPFSLTRYFAPWRPIPVAPIGLAFLSPYGVRVAAAELILFSPILLLALRPLRWPTRSVIAGVSMALWLALVWLISSGDSIREAVIGFIVREDTAYTSGFAEDAFLNIQPGVSAEDVRHRLGEPFGEDWMYSKESEHLEVTSDSSLGGCRMVLFERGVVVKAFDVDVCARRGIVAGTPMADVSRLLGGPRDSCWRYTWSPRNAHYRMRAVCFVNGKVEAPIRQWQ